MAASALSVRPSRKQKPRPRLASDFRRTEQTSVASPYGGTDRPMRVVDSIEIMYRRGTLDGLQKAAADRYEWAHKHCPASMHGPLEPDAVHGSFLGSPMHTQLQAAAWLHEAHALLGTKHRRFFEAVVGERQTIGEFLASIFPNPTFRQRDNYGWLLRDCLEALAEMWWPNPRQRIRSIRDAEPLVVVEGEIARSAVEGKVAHCSRRGVVQPSQSSSH